MIQSFRCLRPILLALISILAAAGQVVSCPDPGTAPSAGISASPNPACVGVMVTFQAMDPEDKDTDMGKAVNDQVTTFTWDFGDGGTATGQTVTHVYNACNPQGYTVTLTLDDAGNPFNDEPGRSTTTMLVTAVTGVAGPDACCVGASAIYNAEMCLPTNCSNVTWSGGGDPSTGSGCSFSTRFDTPGDKTVTATCGTSHGAKQTDVIGGQISPTERVRLLWSCTPTKQTAVLNAAGGQPSCAQYSWSVSGPLSIQGPANGSSVTIVADVDPPAGTCTATVTLSYMCSGVSCSATKEIEVLKVTAGPEDLSQATQCVTGNITWAQISQLTGISIPPGCNPSDFVRGFLKPASFTVTDQCGRPFANEGLDEDIQGLTPGGHGIGETGGSTDANGLGNDYIGWLTCDESEIYAAVPYCAIYEQKWSVANCLILHNCIKMTITRLTQSATDPHCGVDFDPDVTITKWTGYADCQCP